MWGTSYLKKIHTCICIMQMHVRIQKILSGWVLTSFFSHRYISQRAVRTSLEKQLDPRGPMASRGGFCTSISKETLLSLVISPVLPSESAHGMREQRVNKSGDWQEKSYCHANQE